MNNDALLIEQAQRDTKAFDALYQKYVKSIYYFFWPRVGNNKEIAEDLTQETFIRAYANLSSYQDRGYSYRAYLMGISRNLLVDYYRKPKTIGLEDVEYLAIHDPHEDLEKKNLKYLLFEAIKKLSYGKRLVLYLYYWSGYSIKEIAHLTQKSENAVKLLLMKGRRALAIDPVLFTLIPVSA